MIDATIDALTSTITTSMSYGGHDHLLLRASMLELCSLYGNQWVPSLAEQHKRMASYYLVKAAKAGTDVLLDVLLFDNVLGKSSTSFLLFLYF